MIDIKNVNKKFNKLVAINNTSLTLDSKGLISLLGPSGSGKTTLLNVIGGLDKINKGSIYIDGEKISSKWQYKIDKIRNEKIGYIFQDFKLINSMTVFDNVAIVLRMLGVKDKKEINERVKYVLDKVGMYRFHKRYTSNLSGGERQRVAIARALVKDPNIILADEPTGNLDSKNSLEIMKIIKSISKDRLVILVTHEEKLARFYSDRIVEIEDGKVKNDYINDHKDDLDYRIDNSFYLKDFKTTKKVKSNEININIYEDESLPFNIDVVLKKGNIYIRTNSNDNVTLIDDTSNATFIDDHYKKINNIEEDNFDIKPINNKKYKSVNNIFKIIKNGFIKVFNYKKSKKFILITFFVSTIIVQYSISNYFGLLVVDDKDFVRTNKENISILNSKVTLDDYNKFENYKDVDYVIPGNSMITTHLVNKMLYQMAVLNENIDGSLTSSNDIKNIIYGRKPVTNYEIVIDKFGFDDYIRYQPTFTSAGINSIEKLVGATLEIPNMKPFTIVGVTDDGSPNIYMNEDLFTNVLYNASKDLDTKNVYDYNLFKDEAILKEGRLPLNDYEIMVNISNKDEMKLNKDTNVFINGRSLTVVGYYTSKNNLQYYLANNNTIKYNLITSKENLTVHSKNRNKVMENLYNDKIAYKDVYVDQERTYMKNIKKEINSKLITLSVVFVITILEIIFMLRSTFLSKVTEIGIYRAVGLKKIDIYKMFFGEIFALSTISIIPATYITWFCINKITKFNNLFKCDTSIGLFILVAIFLYLFNIIIGLMPLNKIMRKRPAEILARTDNI